MSRSRDKIQCLLTGQLTLYFNTKTTIIALPFCLKTWCFFHAFFLCLRLLFFSICANSPIISSNPLPVYTHLSSLYKTEQTQIRRYIVFRMKRREVKSERETIIEISEDPFLYW